MVQDCQLLVYRSRPDKNDALRVILDYQLHLHRTIALVLTQKKEVPLYPLFHRISAQMAPVHRFPILHPLPARHLDLNCVPTEPQLVRTAPMDDLRHQ